MFSTFYQVLIKVLEFCPSIAAFFTLSLGPHRRTNVCSFPSPPKDKYPKSNQMHDNITNQKAVIQDLWDQIYLTKAHLAQLRKEQMAYVKPKLDAVGARPKRRRSSSSLYSPSSDSLVPSHTPVPNLMNIDLDRPEPPESPQLLEVAIGNSQPIRAGSAQSRAERSQRDHFTLQFDSCPTSRALGQAPPVPASIPVQMTWRPTSEAGMEKNYRMVKVDKKIKPLPTRRRAKPGLLQLGNLPVIGRSSLFARITSS